MAEFEELKIIVSLSDQASEPLRRFQESMKETATGRTSRHVEEFGKKTNVVREGLKSLGLEATGTTAKIEALATRVSTLGGGLVALGAAIVIATNEVGKLADAMNKTSRSWEALGTTLAHGRNITEQLARMGVDEQKAMELTGAAIHAHVQAQKRGMTEMFRELRDLGLRFGLEFEEQYRAQLAAAKTPEEYLNAAIEGEQQLADAILKRHKGVLDDNTRAEQAEATRRFREIQGFNSELLSLQRISNLTKEQEQFWNRMDENAKKIAQDWRAVWANIDQIWQVFKSDVFDPELSPFPAMMRAANHATEALYHIIFLGNQSLSGKNFWLEFFNFLALGSIPYLGRKLLEVGTQKGVDYLREHPPVDPHWTPPEGGALGQGGAVPFASLGGGLGGDKEDLDQNTRELKKLNDQLYEMLHPPETARGGAAADGAAGADGTQGAAGADGSSSRGADGSSTTNTSTSTSTTTATQSANANVPPAAINLPQLPGLPPSARAAAPFGSTSTGGFNLFGGGTHPRSSVFLSGGEGGGGGPDDQRDIPTNSLAFLHGVSRTETGVSATTQWGKPKDYATGQAYSLKQQQHDYPGHPENYDFGVLQMNRTDRLEAEKLGMAHDRAIHLQGGEYDEKGNAPKVKSSIDDQMRAGDEYLRLKYPTAYKNLVENNDYAGMMAATKIDKGPGKKPAYKWFGPADRPSEAKQAYDETRDAARVSGAAVAGAGALHGEDYRTTLDKAGAGATRQSVDAAGMLRVDIPHDMSGGRPNSSSLFNKTPMQQQNQMMPAQVGPPEPARAAALAG